MSRGIVIALIIAGAGLIAVAAMIYFSPYQTCVRATADAYASKGAPVPIRAIQEYCAVGHAAEG